MAVLLVEAVRQERPHMTDMEEKVKKAFDFASDSTKQLITLSTAILTLTITFGKDVLQKVDASTKDNLTYAWIVYLVSIFFGIMTLLALTGTLDPIKRKKKKQGSTYSGEAIDQTVAASAAQVEPVATIQGANVRLLSFLQIVSFLVATGLIVKTGITALNTTGDSSGTTNNVEQVVRDKQRILVEALMRRDAAALEQNLAIDCVIMGSLGQVMNRTQVVSALNSGELAYESINIDDATVRVYGDTAVESGHAVVKGKYKEQDLSGQFRLGAAFVKKQEGWQVVSIQIARVDQPANIQPAPAVRKAPPPRGWKKRVKGKRGGVGRGR